MKRYRFYIGSGPSGDVLDDAADQALLDIGVTAWTVYPVLGYWDGHYESTLVYEILNDSLVAADVAAQLADDCEQECVLYTEEDVEGDLISNTGVSPR
jgi:23S rRNA A1618 N6-methylase RlmF